MVTMSEFKANLKDVIASYIADGGLDGLESVCISININANTVKDFLKSPLTDFAILGWDSYRDCSEHIDICTDLIRIQ